MQMSIIANREIGQAVYDIFSNNIFFINVKALAKSVSRYYNFDEYYLMKNASTTASNVGCYSRMFLENESIPVTNTVKTSSNLTIVSKIIRLFVYSYSFLVYSYAFVYS